MHTQSSQALNFNSDFFETEKEFSNFNNDDIKGKVSGGLWEVDDRVVKNPTLRFQRQESALIQMIYDGGAGPLMEMLSLPKQCKLYLQQKFLPRLGVAGSGLISVDNIASSVFRYLDYEEPYFFLVDMPVQLSQDNYLHTYRHRKTHSTLNPEKLEIFRVKMGWNFPHYTYVHKLLSDPRTEVIARGGFVAHPTNTRNMDMFDVLKPMAEAVYSSNWDYVQGTVRQWMSNFYEDLRYDTKNLDELDRITEAEEQDYALWLAVAVGVMSWLKSPHGLKFLMTAHPIYDSVLEWNEDTDRPMVARDTGGVAVVDGWTIYTARDLDILPGVKPGTCEVSKQELHCTQLVNVHAVMHMCFCGKRRDFLNSDPYSSEKGHSYEACKRWRAEYPEPQMRFISYAALDNQISGRDPKTKCQRHSCPNTGCSYHAGYGARIQALTDNRTRMLTGTVNT